MMLWPPEYPRRGARRTRRRSWVERLVMFTVLLALAGACCRIGFMAYHPFDAPYPAPDCRIVATCPQTLPMCGPDAQIPPYNQPVWYWGRQQPRNTPALLGFQPLLPTRIVGRTFGWDSALLVGPQQERDAPLLRESYAKPPHWNAVDGVPGVIPPTPEPARPSSDTIYVLDETTAVTDPLVDVKGKNTFEFAAQRDITVGTATGTLYYLAPIGGFPVPPPTPVPPTPTATPYSSAQAAGTPVLLTANTSAPAAVSATPLPTAVPAYSYFALMLLWRVGPVHLRMLAVSNDPWYLEMLVTEDPAYQTRLSPIHVWPQIPPPFPPESAESDLLQTAASVQPYTGCGP